MLYFQIGAYTEVDTPEGLRAKMGSYYNQFSRTEDDNSKPIITVPYIDFAGLGTY